MTASSDFVASPSPNNQPIPQSPRPTDESPSDSKPSFHRTITTALELAGEAVRLDTVGDEPIGAIQAYSRGVALLNESIELVRDGKDTNESRGGRHGGWSKSVVTKEEQLQRLKSIVCPLHFCRWIIAHPQLSVIPMQIVYIPSVIFMTWIPMT